MVNASEQSAWLVCCVLCQLGGKLCRAELLYFPFENESSPAVRRLSCWYVSGDRENDPEIAKGLMFCILGSCKCCFAAYLSVCHTDSLKTHITLRVTTPRGKAAVTTWLLLKIKQS